MNSVVINNQSANPSQSIREQCLEKGLRMTGQREVIIQVLAEASDHPDVEELYRRACQVDAGISMATVYRTVKLFEDVGILVRHDFGDGRGRFEDASVEHHDHLIDTTTGKVIEFRNEEMEALQHRIAAELGYRLVDHRMELYGVPLDKADKAKQAGDTEE